MHPLHVYKLYMNRKKMKPALQWYVLKVHRIKGSHVMVSWSEKIMQKTPFFGWFYSLEVIGGQYIFKKRKLLCYVYSYELYMNNRRVKKALQCYVLKDHRISGCDFMAGWSLKSALFWWSGYCSREHWSKCASFYNMVPPYSNSILHRCAPE